MRKYDVQSSVKHELTLEYTVNSSDILVNSYHTKKIRYEAMYLQSLY